MKHFIYTLFGLAINLLIGLPIFGQCSSFDGQNFEICYGDDQTITETYCVDDPNTQSIVLDVTSGSVGFGDLITIYDGSDNTAPQIAQYTDQAIILGTFDAPSGCITIEIVGDLIFSCEAPAPPPNPQINPFVYTVSCTCSPPTASFNYSSNIGCSSDATNASDYEITFDASASSAVGGLTIDIYRWDFGDGVTMTSSTPTISHTFAEPGGHVVELVVIDSNGCESFFVEQFVMISGPPELDIVIPQTICQGESFEATLASQSFYSWEPLPEEISSGTINSGINYGGTEQITLVLTEAILVDAPSNVFITDGDLLTITLNIVHTWFGDLGFVLICPDGTAINLHALVDWTGLDDDLVGCCYTFTMSASQTLLQAAEEGDDNILSGDYLPTDDFSLLQGCPIAGEWQLLIYESHPEDQGNLIEWSINFGEDFGSTNAESFSVNTDFSTAVWSGDGMNANGQAIAPMTPGTYTYTYSYTDELGCMYEENFDVEVLPPSDPACVAPCTNDVIIDDVATICEGETVILPDVDGTEVTPIETTTYDMLYAGTDTAECEVFYNFTVTVNPLPTVDLTSVVFVCTNDPVLDLNTVDVSPTGGIWYEGSDNTGSVLTGSDLILSSLNFGDAFYYEVTDAQNCSNGAAIEIDTSSVFCNDEAIIVFNPDELNFGEIVLEDMDMLTEILVINNIGDLPLDISSFDFENAAFNSGTIQTATIEGQDSLEVPIYFAPDEVGIYESELVLQSNVGSFSIALTGTAVVGTSLNELSNTSIKVFPNPNEGRFYLDTKDEKILSYQIQNILGDIILTERFVTDFTLIDLNKQAKGVYFLSIETEDGIFVEKIVVN